MVIVRLVTFKSQKLIFPLKLATCTLLDFQRFIFLLWMQFFLLNVIFIQCTICFGGWWSSIRIKQTIHSPPPLFSFCVVTGHLTAYSIMCHQENSDKLIVVMRVEVPWQNVQWSESTSSGFRGLVSSCAYTTYQIRQQMWWLPWIWPWRSNSS